MTRSITIARDGSVGLNGKLTMWMVAYGGGLWKVYHGRLVVKSVDHLAAARAYLEALTDEELMA